MAGSIPRSFIDDVLSKTDIVDIISSRVKLKKAGKEYHACCPFHHEKTPSFTVSPQKQFYYCFGCHAKGNAISFLMEYDNLSFVETIEELAGRLGLSVPYEKSHLSPQNASNNTYENKRDLYTLMQDITHFYQKMLSQSPSAQQYLINRGLSQAVIARFQIGYAPQGYEVLQKTFGSRPDFCKHFSALGMLSKNDRNQVYDRFRHRIMFPIRDRRGRVIAFGGRVLDDSKPKYLNSPESATYHKGNELYGLFEATENHRQLPQLLIVEGYMDVVALAQFGVDYAIASLGTATTPAQLHLAFRSTDQLLCCYDADRAGRDAAWRALENALPLLEDGRQMKFIFLPDGEDPDSFIRQQGKTGFEQYLQQAQSLSEFFFAHLKPQVDFSSNEGKLKLLQLAIPMIKQIPGLGLKNHLLNQLKNLTGIWDDHLIQQLFTPKENTLAPSSNNIPRVKHELTPMRMLISLLLQQPRLAHLTTQSGKKIILPPEESFDEAGFHLFATLFKQCQDNLGITTGQLLEHWRHNASFHILETLATFVLPIDESFYERTFIENLCLLQQKFLDKRVANLIAKERANGLTLNEKKELAQLVQRNYK